MSSDKMKKFDWAIKQRLSDLLQTKRFFQLDTEWSKQFSFACVVQDRLKDAIEYLDSHLEPPKSRDELYLFMVHADNVFSAVREFFELEVVNKRVPYPYSKNNNNPENFTFFKDVFKKAFSHIPKELCPIDDDFFKYFRSLSFAHPYETSRQGFIDSKGKEIHYSPYSSTRNERCRNHRVFQWAWEV